jgi:hypothetical protein
MEKVDVAVRCPLSETWTVNWKNPLRVGVPVIVPEEENCNPGGMLPERMLQV